MLLGYAFIVALVLGIAATIFVGNPFPLVLLWGTGSIACAVTAKR